MSLRTATFGAGCFWCLEAALNETEGVQHAISGYMGGHTNDPDYHAVCSGNTGHAEVVQVEYHEEAISFSQLCLLFFTLHDPTQLNRQGNDIGSQYRSVIFFHTPEQQQQAMDIIAQLEEKQIYGSQIVTEISPASTFYPAEAYHQGYYKANPEQAYCQFIIAPKMAKFRQIFSQQLKQ